LKQTDFRGHGEPYEQRAVVAHGHQRIDTAFARAGVPTGTITIAESLRPAENFGLLNRPTQQLAYQPCGPAFFDPAFSGNIF